MRPNTAPFTTAKEFFFCKKVFRQRAYFMPRLSQDGREWLCDLLYRVYHTNRPLEDKSEYVKQALHYLRYQHKFVGPFLRPTADAEAAAYHLQQTLLYFLTLEKHDQTNQTQGRETNDSSSGNGEQQSPVPEIQV